MGKIKPVVIYFSQSGEKLAQKIATYLGAKPYLSPDKNLVQKRFQQGVPIIGICASGILVRFLAPIIDDKKIEPPVISISNDGKNIVPLLGGHHGANNLAEDLASFLDGNAAITTASNAQFGFALDEPPRGYVLADIDLAKNAMAAILSGEKIIFDGEAGWLKEAGYEVLENGFTLRQAQGEAQGEGEVQGEGEAQAQGEVQGEGEEIIKIVVSEKIAEKNTLTYHPKTLFVGVGCERYLPMNELIDLVEKTLANNQLSKHSIAAIVSIDVKADEKAINELAAYYNVPLRLFSANELAAEEARLPNISEIVRQEVGTPSVAEAAAIKAGELIIPKQKSKRATCAIGKANAPIMVEEYGRARGILHIVGIGPGEEVQRTASCVKALENSSDWVGYGFYLDLIADLNFGQEQHCFMLGDEEKRVRYALELAASGKTVSLVCSGDGQIYAMAALVFELLDATGERAISDNAKRVEIKSHPGISALQMASSRVGALLGHDFCAISLSDLLTPKAVIIERLEAAASADFVVAFYNPRSKTRTDLLDRAKEIFIKNRPADTPVIIARSLGRKEEKVQVVTLADFDVEQVDMMSIVLFGASCSKSFLRGNGEMVAFTPRGYFGKMI